MQLKTDQLRTFLKRTSYIKHNNILPILDHILIEPGRIVKSNLTHFAAMTIESKEAVLIDERTLSGLLSQTSAEVITITIGKKVTISDGLNKLTHPFTEITHYPKMPVVPGDAGCEITQEMIDAMVIARSFTSSIETETELQKVHLKEKYIAATDRYKVYYEKFDTLFPNVWLDASSISLINGIGPCTLRTDEKRYYFGNNEMQYAFSKTEDYTPDFNMLVNQWVKDGVAIVGEPLSISRQEIVEFCDMVNSVSTSQVNTCVINKSGYSLIDEDKPVVKESPLPDVDFRFNSKLIAGPLKALQFDVLNGNLIGNIIVIIEGSAIIALMGLMK